MTQTNRPRSRYEQAMQDFSDDCYAARLEYAHGDRPYHPNLNPYATSSRMRDLFLMNVLATPEENWWLESVWQRIDAWEIRDISGDSYFDYFAYAYASQCD